MATLANAGLIADASLDFVRASASVRVVGRLDSPRRRPPVAASLSTLQSAIFALQVVERRNLQRHGAIAVADHLVGAVCALAVRLHCVGGALAESRAFARLRARRALGRAAVAHLKATVAAA